METIMILLTGQLFSYRKEFIIKYTNWFNNKYIYFSVKSKALNIHG